MLANYVGLGTGCGTHAADVHVRSAFRYELLDFIAEQLSKWRDDPDRTHNISETKLTEHLCDYLTGVARKSAGWDILQFRTEAADESQPGRKIDFAPKPCGTVIWIDGRRYTQYEPLLPVECKRLPTPPGEKRDEQEYVFNRHASTGGIQRFKSGHHGASHNLAAMIAHIEAENPTVWKQRLAEWLQAIV